MSLQSSSALVDAILFGASEYFYSFALAEVCAKIMVCRTETQDDVVGRL